MHQVTIDFLDLLIQQVFETLFDTSPPDEEAAVLAMLWEVYAYDVDQRQDNHPAPVPNGYELRVGWGRLQPRPDAAERN